MTMHVTVNGQARGLPAGATLADLVAGLTDQGQSLATALNGEFVPRDARAHTPLREGDAVFTFQPVTGG